MLAAALAPQPAQADAKASLVTPVAHSPTPDFWTGLWKRNEIAFHLPSVNAALLKHGAAWIGQGNSAEILVPLCGKSEDLAHLSALSGVARCTGVEIVGQALSDFAAEHKQLKLRREGRAGPYAATVSADGKLRLLQGDILALPADGAYTHIWDRASLIAMDPQQRAAYVTALTGALATGGRVLLQVLTREAGPEAARKAGPPFSVSDADVKALYGGRYSIRLLERSDALDSNRRFRAQGLTRVTQSTFLLVKK